MRDELQMLADLARTRLEKLTKAQERIAELHTRVDELQAEVITLRSEVAELRIVENDAALAKAALKRGVYPWIFEKSNALRDVARDAYATAIRFLPVKDFDRALLQRNPDDKEGS